MAQGERSFTTQGKEPIKFERTPVPPGDYEGKLCTDSTEVKSRPEPGSIPFVGGTYFELLDTGKDGAKNRRCYWNVFCSLKPGSDGVAMPERINQITGLAKALGEDFTTDNLIDRPNKNGGTETIIHPQVIERWLKAHDGAVVKLHVRRRAGTKEYPDPSNEVEYFIKGEESETPTMESGEELMESESNDIGEGLPPLDDALPPPRQTMANGAQKSAPTKVVAQAQHIKKSAPAKSAPKRR